MNDAASLLRTAFHKAQKRGLTMAGFTKAVRHEVGGTRGSSESSLRDYLHGRVSNPRSEIVAAMARILGLQEEFVLHGTGDPTPAEKVVREAASEHGLWIDDDRGFTLDAVVEIKKSSIVANSPTTVVRAGFFELLRQVTGSPAWGLDKTVEATAEMASFLDHFICQPIEVFYPKGAPPMTAEQVRNYLTGVLHALTLLVPQDDSGGRFDLSQEPVVDAAYISRVILSAADRWSMQVPLGEKEAMVPLGNLDRDGVRKLADQCRLLSKDLDSASWRLGTAAEGMDDSECARDSKALAGELPLLSRIAPALGAGVEEEARGARVQAERGRVWAVLEEMAGDLSVEEFLTEAMADERVRRDRSKEKEDDDE